MVQSSERLTRQLFPDFWRLPKNDSSVFSAIASENLPTIRSDLSPLLAALSFIHHPGQGKDTSLAIARRRLSSSAEGAVAAPASAIKLEMSSPTVASTRRLTGPGSTSLRASDASVNRRLLPVPTNLVRRASLGYDELRTSIAAHPALAKRNRSKFVAGATVAVMVLFVILRHLRESFAADPPPPCDAHQAPGRLLLNLTSPLYTHWRPLNEARCPALPPYLPAMWELLHGPERPLPRYSASMFGEEYRLAAASPEPPPRSWTRSTNNTATKDDPIAFLRKKRSIPPTVLLLGDSVDRNGLVHFCQLFKRNVTISHYHDITKHPPGGTTGDLTKGHGPKFDGWDQRGLPHLCEIPFHSHQGKGQSGVAMRVVNGFHYGMDALDEFDTPDHADWHKPGRVEVRIQELVVPMLAQMGGVDSVDVVQLHSGMWDLALFGLQDDKTKWSLTVPLTPEQLAWWQERMRRTIYHVRQTFPRARVVFRKLHRTDDLIAGTQYITNRERVHQLRHLQEEVARSEGLPFFDFGHLLEGYQLFQEKVHPLMVPGGVVYAQNLIHQLRLALESKHNWRRGFFKGA